MVKGVMVVQSNPVSPSREDDFNDWYDNTHVPEVLAVPGFVSARRYKAHRADAAGPAYLAIYELDADDLTAPLAELRARAATGGNHGTDAVALDPPPVVTFYELLE